jgi:hypothetical protein
MLAARERVHVDGRWIALSVAAAALTAAASAGGIFLSSVYAKETPLWAVQGAGQDAVNLGVVVPLLLVTAWRVRGGSARAVLVWLGLLLYLAYSYVLYAFFVHFNALFLIYVGVLGTSVFALGGGALAVHGDAAHWAPANGERALSTLLMTSGVIFGGLWLSEIVPALAAATVPKSAIDAGLIVNPVHVLDLAFVVPAMFATSVLLWRRHPLGHLAAIPLATFMVVMAVAIVGMAIAIGMRGLGSAAVAAPMACLAAVTAWLASRLG